MPRFFHGAWAVIAPFKIARNFEVLPVTTPKTPLQQYLTMIYRLSSSGQIFHFLFAALRGNLRATFAIEQSDRNFSWLFRRPFQRLIAIQDIRPTIPTVFSFFMLCDIAFFMRIRRNEIFFDGR